jgi:DNA-binding NtrC family response regulator
MTAESKMWAGSSVAAPIGKPKVSQSILAMGESSSHEDAGRHLALIVDDNLDLLAAAAKLFQYHGFEVLTAGDAAEAMEILRHTSDVQVLFTDVVMPGMSGIQLGYEARKLMPRLKIILTSGYTSIAVQTGPGTINDFNFVQKPYRFSDVLKFLAKPD